MGEFKDKHEKCSHYAGPMSTSSPAASKTADMPSAQELLVFLTLNESGSITDAAEDLHLSQSQLSRILQRLERKLSVTLFRRSTAGLRLTPEGEIFTGTASALQNSYIHNMRQFRNELAGETGEVRLSILPSMAFEFLGSWTDAFRKSHPQATITATDDISGSALQQLESGTVDVAISACLLRLPDGRERQLFPKLDDLNLTAILSERFALVSPPGTEVPSEMTWDYALGHSTVGFTPAASVHRCMSQISQLEGIAYQPETLTNSPLTIAGMVESGLGSSIVPESNLGIMRIRQLVTTPLEGYRRIVCVATADSEQTALVRHFVTMLTTK